VFQVFVHAFDSSSGKPHAAARYHEAKPSQPASGFSVLLILSFGVFRSAAIFSARHVLPYRAKEDSSVKA
jgi:hypothetical protein